MHIEGIVVKKVVVREHDQLVTLYTQNEGKLVAIAKGSLSHRSRQASALDDGNLIRCELVGGKNYPIITSAQPIRCFMNAKSSLVSWAVGQFFLQTLDIIVFERQPDKRLWNVYSKILHLLDEKNQSPLSVLRHGQAEMLEALGHGSHVVPNAGPVRTELDDLSEAIAQRRLSAIGLCYLFAQLI